MIIESKGLFYVIFKDKNDRDMISGSFLTKDEALRNLIGVLKQITDYLVEALDTPVGDEN
jgi:hypothetical protein